VTFYVLFVTWYVREKTCCTFAFNVKDSEKGYARSMELSVVCSGDLPLFAIKTEAK
jgi:hypothetical protein